MFGKLTDSAADLGYRAGWSAVRHAPESVACVWLVMVAVILYWLMMVSFPVSWIVCPAIPCFFFLAFRSSAALPAKAGSVQSIAPGAARLRGDLTGSATPV